MNLAQRSILIVAFLIVGISLGSFPAEALSYKERVGYFEELSWGIFPKKSLGVFTATAYDLSVGSCGKDLNHPAYGVTASGARIANKSRYEARTIAVDPSVIPLGSFVFVEFLDDRGLIYNDFYVARDTGSKIKGPRIDVYLGVNEQKACIDFGVIKANIYLLKMD